jgi:parallel beta-helix repeat protein
MAMTSNAATIYVSPEGNDQATGSINEPIADINLALDKAGRGGTVLLRQGVYRQRITLTPKHSGTPDQMTTITNHADEKPILKGSDVITGWKKYKDNIWQHDNWPTASQQVYVDGKVLKQIGSQNVIGDVEDGMQRRVIIGKDVNDLIAGSFYYDTTTKSLYVWLEDGGDPNKHLLEAGVRDYIIRPAQHAQVQYVAVKNLTFRHSNACTPEIEKPYNYAMVTIGNDGLIENCDIQWGDFRGVMMGRNTKLINSIIANMGNCGVDASPRSPWLVSGCTITNNGHRQYLGWHCGGLKLIPDAYGTIENCLISDNWGPGVWFDWSDTGGQIVIRNNRILNNRATQMVQGKIRHIDVAGIKIETSRNVLIYNNLIAGNDGNGIIIMASSAVEVFNNTFVANKGFAAVQAGGVPRGAKKLGGGRTLDNINVVNNVFYNNLTAYDVSLQFPVEGRTDKVTFKLNSDYNCYYRFGGPVQMHTGGTYAGFLPVFDELKIWQEQTGLDEHSQLADPKFVDVKQGNYQPGSDSPLRDASVGFGQPWTPPMFDAMVDLAGITRLRRLDVGAYESVSQRGQASPVTFAKPVEGMLFDDGLPASAMSVDCSNHASDPRRFWLMEAVDPKPASGAMCVKLIAENDSLRLTGLYYRAPVPTAGYRTLSALVWLSPEQTPSQLFLAIETGDGNYHGSGFGFDSDIIDLPSQVASIDPDTGARLAGSTARTVTLGKFTNKPTTGKWVEIQFALPTTSASQIRSLILGATSGVVAIDQVRLLP